MRDAWVFVFSIRFILFELYSKILRNIYIKSKIYFYTFLDFSCNSKLNKNEYCNVFLMENWTGRQIRNFNIIPFSFWKPFYFLNVFNFIVEYKSHFKYACNTFKIMLWKKCILNFIKFKKIITIHGFILNKSELNISFLVQVNDGKILI